MNYLELSTYICKRAIENRLFNFAAEGNVTELNPLNIKDYPIFLTTGIGPHTDNGTFMRYRLVFYYIDRLSRDDANSTQVYSTGIEALKNLINVLRRDDNIYRVSEEITYTPFESPEGQVLADSCAGVYAELELTVKNETRCYVE